MTQVLINNSVQRSVDHQVLVNQVPAGYKIKKRGLLRRGAGAGLGGGLGAAKGSAVGGTKGAALGGLGGGAIGGLGGAAQGLMMGGLPGAAIGGLGGAAAGAGLGAGVGGGIGMAGGGIKGGFRGMRQGGRRYKLSVNESGENRMLTKVAVNNSEQRRVQTQMTLNRLNASMEPVEMVTENSRIQAVRKAGARFMAGAKGVKKGVGRKAKSGTPYKAGRKVRETGMKTRRAGQETSRYLGTKEGGRVATAGTVGFVGGATVKGAERKKK